MADETAGQGSGGVVGRLAAVALLAVAAATPTPTAPADQSTDQPQHKVGVGHRGTTKSGLLGRIDLFQQSRPATSIPVAVVKKFADDRAGRLAALIAYYGFFSLFPALLALVTVLHFVLENNPDLRDDIADSALAQFPIVGESIAESLSNPISGNTVALVIGLVGAVWAGMGMVQACQDAMNEVWAVKRADFPGFVGKRVRSLIMLTLLALMVIVSTAISQLIALFGLGIVGGALVFLGTIFLNVAVFMVAFRVLTVEDVTWRQVAPGAAFSGVAYTLIQYLGGVYVTRTLDGASETYGTFAVVIGLLSWIFLIAQVMMLGGELNTVMAKRLWPRSLFTEPATTGDRRSHAEQAKEQAMDDTMVVDVSFKR